MSLFVTAKEKQKFCLRNIHCQIFEKSRSAANYCSVKF